MITDSKGRLCFHRCLSVHVEGGGGGEGISSPTVPSEVDYPSYQVFSRGYGI